MTRLVRTAKAAGAGLADLIWPRRSIIDRSLSDGPVSPADFGALTFLTGPSCRRCAAPQDADLGPRALCAACSAKPPRWDRARAALAYDEVSKQPILALKRAGARDGLATLAGWMAAAGRDLLAEADLVTPVPLHYVRLVQRGYNQAGWLAQAVGRAAGAPVCVDALKRARRTRSQGGLSARARRRNVAGAFKVRKSRRRRVAGKRIVLIDDVYTTGATLNACARALLKAGASSVDVLVLARVVRETDIAI
ncbi:MAG: ComF family protein [Pseudomonadota bacterium]